MHARAALTLLFAGCGGPPSLPPLPRVAGRPRPAAEARALVESLASRERAVPAWKAVHVLEVEDRAADRRATLHGVLLVKRPDRFRLRLLGPAGVTAMDLLYVAPRYRLEVPGRPPLSGDDAASERRLPIAAMARAFLREYGEAPRALHVASRRKRLDFADRTLVLGDDDLVLVDSAREDGEEVLRLTYADYRDVSGHRLPMTIRMDVPRRDLTVRVRVQRYDVAPQIPEGAFARVLSAPSADSARILQREGAKPPRRTAKI